MYTVFLFAASLLAIAAAVALLLFIGNELKHSRLMNTKEEPEAEPDKSIEVSDFLNKLEKSTMVTSQGKKIDSDFDKN